MDSRRWVRLVAAACLLVCGGDAVAADDATLLRVFLSDGTSFVSYGEPARVGDRVIFSMPTASMPDPPLHLMNLAADRIDWARTDRYATAAREAHYIKTQADLDYAELSNRVTQALNDLTASKDAVQRLAIAQAARKTLATWPQDHYNYRLDDVRQMLSLLDEAIADLRAATGSGRFDLSLSTFTDPPVAPERLLPPPTPREVIEQVLTAARQADAAADRTALLRTALTSLDRDSTLLPPDWLAATRAETQKQLESEILVDRNYQGLSHRMMTMAVRRARAADVRGLERLVETVHARDLKLGARRPETVGALIAAIQLQLDAARQLRLARDRWALRAEAFRGYRAAIEAPVRRFVSLKRSLEQIKSLAGNSSGNLALLERRVAQILRQVGTIAPPAELRPAHALLVSAVQLAGHAARIRRQATLADDIARAWDASSAAAGALMLGARARSDIRAALRRPQLQ